MSLVENKASYWQSCVFSKEKHREHPEDYLCAAMFTGTVGGMIHIAFSKISDVLNSQDIRDDVNTCSYGRLAIRNLKTGGFLGMDPTSPPGHHPKPLLPLKVRTPLPVFLVPLALPEHPLQAREGAEHTPLIHL